MSGDSHRASIVEELPEHLSLHKLVHGYRNEPYLGLLESSG